MYENPWKFEVELQSFLSLRAENAFVGVVVALAEFIHNQRA